MQLEQQETFEIKSPQLEVFGQVESKLPAPAKKRPFAAGFLAVMVLVSVFGIGGVQLKSRYRNVAEIYTSEVDKHGNSIQGDFTTLTDTAANLMRACQKVLGGWANIANEYATKRYRSNLINWGMLPFLIQPGDLPFKNLDYLFIPGIKIAVEDKAEEIKAYVVTTGEGMKEFTLKLGELTDEERQIILKGCLINYNRV